MRPSAVQTTVRAATALLLAAACLPAQRPPERPRSARILRVGPLEAGPGEVVTGNVLIDKRLDGSKIRLPFILVNGMRPGPVLGLFACMYGKGYEAGIETVVRLTRDVVAPKTLKGAIIASPVINPSAFNTRTTHAVEDGVDLQEAFPGDPHGTHSRRLAAFLFENAVKQCDAVINLHAKAGMDWSVVMTHDDPEVQRRSVALAEAYGTPIFTMSHKRHPNFLVVAAMNEGIPAFISEPVYASPHDRPPGTSIRGLLNVMKYLGMLEGRIDPQTDNLVPSGRYLRTIIRSREAGIIQVLKEPGDPVKKGEAIALVRTVLGDVVERIKSPGAGYFRRAAPGRVVQMGGYVGEIFQIPDR